MEMSLSQAALAAKRTRQCLASAIKKGRLSAIKDPNGEWKIDSAELVRVYPNCNRLGQNSAPTEQVVDADTAVEVAVLRVKLEAAESLRKTEEERRREAETRLAKAERDLDAERERFDNYVRALPSGLAPVQVQPAAPIPMPPPEPAQAQPRTPEPPVVASQLDEWIEVPEEPQKPKKRGFLARWFGGGDDAE